MRIEFLGHASFCIINELTIYIDPYKIRPEHTKKADLILITHDHFDHFSIDDIRRISTNKTTIIIPEYMSSNLPHTKLISTHETIELNNPQNSTSIRISTIPAYNLKKSYHNKGQGVGYIIDFFNNNKIFKTIYHSGDTDFVDEMRILKGLDYALISVGGTYTMDPEQASEFIKAVKPKNVIPMHYGNYLGINLESNLNPLEKTCKKEKINFIPLKPSEFIDIF